MVPYLDSAELPTPPLSAAASEYGKEFSFDDVQGAGETSRATLRYERKLGDTEVSYFLSSRQAGVNDMYVEAGLRARNLR